MIGMAHVESISLMHPTWKRRCSKHYPKELCDDTIVHNDGYPKYCH